MCLVCLVIVTSINRRCRHLGGLVLSPLLPILFAHVDIIAYYLIRHYVGPLYYQTNPCIGCLISIAICLLLVYFC